MLLDIGTNLTYSDVSTEWFFFFSVCDNHPEYVIACGGGGLSIPSSMYLCKCSKDKDDTLIMKVALG